MIYKDKTKILRFVSDVVLYIDGVQGQTSVGIIPDGKVTIKAEAIKAKDLEGVTYAIGYDISYEITSMNLYDLRRWEQINNKTGWIEFQPAHLYLQNVRFNIEVDINVNTNERGLVKLTGTKRCENITDVIHGHNWAGVWDSKWTPPASGIGS